MSKKKVALYLGIIVLLIAGSVGLAFLGKPDKESAETQTEETFQSESYETEEEWPVEVFGTEETESETTAPYLEGVSYKDMEGLETFMDPSVIEGLKQKLYEYADTEGLLLTSVRYVRGFQEADTENMSTSFYVVLNEAQTVYVTYSFRFQAFSVEKTDMTEKKLKQKAEEEKAKEQKAEEERDLKLSKEAETANEGGAPETEAKKKKAKKDKKSKQKEQTAETEKTK